MPLGLAGRARRNRFAFNAGIKAQPAVFLFSDTQIVFEAMLEDINNVLNTVESVLKLKLNLSHDYHAGRRPEPLRARR